MGNERDRRDTPQARLPPDSPAMRALFGGAPSARRKEKEADRSPTSDRRGRPTLPAEAIPEELEKAFVRGLIGKTASLAYHGLHSLLDAGLMAASEARYGAAERLRKAAHEDALQEVRRRAEEAAFLRRLHQERAGVLEEVAKQARRLNELRSEGAEIPEEFEADVSAMLEAFERDPGGSQGMLPGPDPDGKP